jgi:hypothetical protein
MTRASNEHQARTSSALGCPVGLLDRRDCLFARPECVCVSRWYSPNEIEQFAADLKSAIERDNARMERLENKSPPDIRIHELMISEYNDALSRLGERIPDDSCFAYKTEGRAKRDGGYSPNWPERWKPIRLLLGPSLALLLAGFVGLWIAGGFRTSAQSLQPFIENTAIERRFEFYAVVAAGVVVIYGAVLAHLYVNGTADDFWKYVGLFLGPVLVAFGWVFTNEINIRNSRKQHTINLILQYFTNAQRIADKDALRKALPKGTTIDDVRGLDGPNADLLLTVMRELNYFDFLASAILRREIDEGLMRRVFEDIVIGHAIQLWPDIKKSQQRGTENTWADFVALYRRWTKTTDPTLT